jgi:hypothetical protein
MCKGKNRDNACPQSELRCKEGENGSSVFVGHESFD